MLSNLQRKSFPSGSRAEGLAVEDGWGHPQADHDMMVLHTDMNFQVTPDDFLRDRFYIMYHTAGCQPAYCKLRVTRILALKKIAEDEVIDMLIQSEHGILWINTFSLLTFLQGGLSEYAAADDAHPDTIRGPAGQTVTGSHEYVPALVGSAPHPYMKTVFKHKDKSTCLSPEVVKTVSEMAMTVVLCGHKASDEYNMEARLSFSLCEFKLIHDQPLVIKQAFIAFKYIVKRVLSQRPSESYENDGRGHLSSYHLKSILLRYIEKRPTDLITSSFECMMELFLELDSFLKAGTLPHYFIEQCDLFQRIAPDELSFVRNEIQQIIKNPFSAILATPTEPKQVFSGIQVDKLATAFLRVSIFPANKWSRNHLRALLHHLDAHRLQTICKLMDYDKTKDISTRPQLTMLVDMFDQAMQML